MDADSLPILIVVLLLLLVGASIRVVLDTWVLRKGLERIENPPEPTHYSVNVSGQHVVWLTGAVMRDLINETFRSRVYRVTVKEREGEAIDGDMRYQAQVWDAHAAIRASYGWMNSETDRPEHPVPGIAGLPYWLVNGPSPEAVRAEAFAWIEDQG